ncbi:MAG: DUF4230 domain-containing protein [Phycisphaerae bacterium]
MAERRSPQQILAIGLACVGVVLALTFGAWWLWRAAWHEPTQAAQAATQASLDSAQGVYEFTKRIAKDVDSVLHFVPEIKVADEVVIHAQKPILELATVERPLTKLHTARGTWLGSTWEIEIKGEYVAKVGFVLDEHTWIDVDRMTQAVTFHVPRPTLLSIEMKQYRVLRDENGLWNKIPTEQREQAVNDMNARARDAAADLDLFAAARTALEQQLRPKLDAGGVPCTFIYENEKK